LVGIVVGHTIMAVLVGAGFRDVSPVREQSAAAVMLVAARGLANDSQRVCAASLPARMT
jgi:hypothetical protein